ncbi:uncharacterized protein LOC134151570 [Rhea pennata]|uniref:uncharacterized protein LOC134151570 n=1 Tax=Rhea pennata TaxID=8795 RepID=UPI002E271A34
MGLPEGMRVYKSYVVLAGGTAAALLLVALTLAFCLPAAEREPAQCQGCAANGTLAWLETQRARWEQAMEQVAVLQTELGSVKQSLEEAHGRWDTCTTRLDTLQRDVTALEQALELLQRQGSEQGAKMASLQEANNMLKEDLEQQRQQLEDVQKGRSSLESQIWNLLHTVQFLQSQRSSGSQLAAGSLAARLSLPAAALAATLLL